MSFKNNPIFINSVGGKPPNSNKLYYDKMNSEYLMSLKFKIKYLKLIHSSQKHIVYKLFKFEENDIRINQNYLYR